MLNYFFIHILKCAYVACGEVIKNQIIRKQNCGDREIANATPSFLGPITFGEFAEVQDI